MRVTIMWPFVAEQAQHIVFLGDCDAISALVAVYDVIG